jgi:hypothetical protein
MKARKRILTVVMLGAIFAFAGLHPSQGASVSECLEIGWLDQSGSWAYCRVYDLYFTAQTMRFRYDYNNGVMYLKVSEKEKPPGEDVYVFRGTWSEDRGRSTGHVFLKLDKGKHHATGWYTKGPSDGEKYALTIGDCVHITP